MAYDPCGTQRLEGDDILKRLAKDLNVSVSDLRNALIVVAKSARVKEIYQHNEIDNV